jgi:protein-S-isoprenylcysteine O-methyltransferase Ste14
VLHRTQRDGRLTTTGPCKSIRHPPYAGFVLIMIGLLLHWPTLPTLAMLPVLVVLYWRLAVEEERETASPFGPAWAGYRRATPGVLSRPGPVSRPRAAGPEV